MYGDCGVDLQLGRVLVFVQFGVWCWWSEVLVVAGAKLHDIALELIRGVCTVRLAVAPVNVIIVSSFS